MPTVTAWTTYDELTPDQRERFGGTPLGVRLTSKLVSDPATGCWTFTGALVRGYGRLTVARKGVPAHRIAYEFTKGPIPDGLAIDHLCRNRACCNPDHLEAVTSRENTLRSTSPAALNAAKTHCPRGHVYDELNTYFYSGKRSCRPCILANSAQRYAQRTGTITAWTKRSELTPDQEARFGAYIGAKDQAAAARAANAEGDRRAAEALKATGGDKFAALELLLARPVAQATRRAA